MEKHLYFLESASPSQQLQSLGLYHFDNECDVNAGQAKNNYLNIYFYEYKSLLISI